ncbi:lipopolysaccharide assembly protein LapA domain-containing protein [Palleronia abyssalis]|uniref:Lipopolysaccharide assembly protein A domain-containing protein n=1 Tax=Palleronia abyssalis TaxID=1501240 RepID=A0A2R8BYC5_9RHOB|nr:LapA family protein [Palleronia abyssalis]SPJ25129.1 hypothetical protein PAA8504_02975 [Palleronia abyssalis]
MRVVKFVVLAIVAVLLVAVALANSQPVTLLLLPETMAAFLGLTWSVTLPMFVVILGAVVIGLLIGFLWEFAREHKHRAAARTERRERESLQREVKKMRAEKPGQGDEILALLEDGSVPQKRAS